MYVRTYLLNDHFWPLDSAALDALEDVRHLLRLHALNLREDGGKSTCPSNTIATNFVIQYKIIKLVLSNNEKWTEAAGIR